MTLRAYLFVLALSTAVAFGTWIFIMATVSPNDATLLDFILFFSTLFVSLIGLFALLESLFRICVLRHRTVVSREIKTAFRHAILLSAVTVFSLLLIAQSVFRWWTLFVLIAIVIGIEYISLLIQHSRRE